MVDDIFIDFDTHSNEFNHYRDIIKNEERLFKAQVSAMSHTNRQRTL